MILGDAIPFMVYDVATCMGSVAAATVVELTESHVVLDVAGEQLRWSRESARDRVRLARRSRHQDILDRAARERASERAADARRSR